MDTRVVILTMVLLALAGCVQQPATQAPAPAAPAAPAVQPTPPAPVAAPEEADVDDAPPDEDAVSAAEGAGEYSLDEVAVHNWEADCWVVVDGNVYDLTAFEHDEVDASQACGTDATAMFGSVDSGLLGAYYLGVVT